MSNMTTPASLLQQVMDRHAAGTPMMVPELFQVDPPIVARLFDDALIERVETRTGIIVVPTAAAAFEPERGQRPVQRDDDEKAPEGWTHEQLEYLRRAYPAGAAFKDMIAELGKTATDVLNTAWRIKLERPRLGPPKRRRRARNAHGGSFEIVAPAWRIRRLRLALEEAFARGQNREDAGDDLDHRALRRAFERGRGAAGQFRRRGLYGKSEIERLRALHEQGLPAAEMARILQREYTGVCKKLGELGLELDNRRWTRDEDARLISGLQLGMTAKELMPFLPGRTRLGIKQRGYNLWPGRGAVMWTEKESARIVEAYENGESIPKVAKELGRGVSSCRWRARYLGLVHPNAVKPYSAAEDRAIREGFKAGRPVGEIADELGREVRGVYCRAFKLGVKHRNSRAWTDEDLATLKRLAESGASGREAAEVLDRELATVYKTAMMRGHPFRSRPKGRKGKERQPDPDYGRRKRGPGGDGGWRVELSKAEKRSARRRRRKERREGKRTDGKGARQRIRARREKREKRGDGQ